MIYELPGHLVTKVVFCISNESDKTMSICTFFGHRDFYLTDKQENKIQEILIDLDKVSSRIVRKLK